MISSLIISFLLGFSICLNIILFLIIFFYFKLKEDTNINIDKGVKNVKHKQFTKKDFENYDTDFFDDSF